MRSGPLARRQAKAKGYLGRNVRVSGKAFELELRLGAGAYICGEETSLLDSLEGKRGMVRPKPPLPAIAGLFGKPTAINNVLSFAAVPTILDKGAAFYKDYGMGRSRGTVPLQLAGNIKRGGLVEKAFGLTLRQVIDEFGGGSATGRPIRAVQVGGPSGAYFPASLLDTPIDYEAMAAQKGMLGHGGIVVFDDSVDMHYKHPSEIMDEIARLTPTFSGVSFDRIRELGSVQWPCNDAAPEGTPIMHQKGFVRGKGRFMITAYIPTDERTGPRFPLILTTGRILSQYNVGAQTRRTENVAWHSEDVLEIHPFDAENRGIRDGDVVSLASRVGETTLHAKISDRMQPGVVYTTFHHVDTGANVVTTEYSDWATSCPEYKVTAVQVRLSNQKSEWQRSYEALREATRKVAVTAAE